MAISRRPGTPPSSTWGWYFLSYFDRLDDRHGWTGIDWYGNIMYCWCPEYVHNYFAFLDNKFKDG
jgi:hypothetical protein